MVGEILAVLAAVIFTPGQADQSAKEASSSHVYWEGGKWLVSEYNGYCIASSAYERDTILFITYNSSLGNVSVGFADPVIKSLKDGDKRKMELDFITGGKLDNGWGDLDFNAMALDSGTMALTSQNLNPEVLDDVAKGQSIGFMYNERVVESLSLTESGPAIAKLRSCASQEAKLHPSDPFS